MRYRTNALLPLVVVLVAGCAQPDDGQARTPDAGGCDDGDPCTRDENVDGRCVHTFQCETPLGS